MSHFEQFRKLLHLVHHDLLCIRPGGNQFAQPFGRAGRDRSVSGSRRSMRRAFGKDVRVHHVFPVPPRPQQKEMILWRLQKERDYFHNEAQNGVAKSNLHLVKRLSSNHLLGFEPLSESPDNCRLLYSFKRPRISAWTDCKRLAGRTSET